MALTVVHTPLRAGEITAVLTGEILDGTMPAGTPLRQAHLAERFGLSRTPIREALQRLVANGIATFQPNFGFRVRSVERSDYLDGLVMRSRLEGLAAERAAVRVTRRDLNELLERNLRLHEITEKVLRSGGDGISDVRLQGAWTQGNAEFHNRLVEMADCPWLSATLATVIALFPREVTWLAAQQRLDILGKYVADHSAIIAALEAGDESAARNAAQRHVDRALENMRLFFEPTREEV